MRAIRLDEATTLPVDGAAGALAGRVWRPDVDGPSVVAVRPSPDGAVVVDISAHFATMRDLCETPDPAAALAAVTGEDLGLLRDILANTPPDGRDA